MRSAVCEKSEKVKSKSEKSKRGGFILLASLYVAPFYAIIIYMPITQTVNIPASRRITLDVPIEVPEGRTILTFTPAPENVPLHECPICAKNCDPETGNPRYNAETVAAIEEGRAMMRGEIPAKRFRSLDEMWEDLMRDDPDETSVSN